MDLNGLTVRDRASKPRAQGLTWCIDDGLPIGAFQDIIQSFHRLVDGVKFGWGTALVTDCLPEKIDVLREYGVDYAFGGTLFEAYWIQNRFDAYLDLVDHYQCPVVEISDGTITLPAGDRHRVIRDLERHVRVFAEVGSKNPAESATWLAEDWIELIERDRESGASMVILESRESGTSGLCLPNGEIRPDLADGILSSGLDPAYLMFEAPQKAHQAYWINKLGSHVNLSNIPMSGIVNLETLRLGLRSDTFEFISEPSRIYLPPKRR